MSVKSSIEAYIQELGLIVERGLREVFPQNEDVPRKLLDAMRYSLMAGGKRMRPILALTAAEALGGSAASALPAACALEMIHTYSLIHDDLPAIDNDDYRRGKPTNHKVFGEAMAVLAGDGLLTHAFRMAARSRFEHGVTAEQTVLIIEELARSAGISGMVGGQAADILGEQGITSLEELEYIHRHKTGDMIVASLRIGGRVAGANERQLQALDTFGSKVGLAFQIQDDILDVVGEEEKLGKRKHSDEKLAKVTYPYFVGIEASRRKVEELTQEGKEALTDPQAGIPNPGRLLDLADYLMERDH